MHRCCNDDTHANGHCPHQHRQGDVLVLHDFLPKMVRRHLVDHRKHGNEDHYAEQCIHDGVENKRGVKFTHFYLPPMYREYPPYVERYAPGLSPIDFGTTLCSLILLFVQPRYWASVSP